MTVPPTPSILSLSKDRFSLFAFASDARSEGQCFDKLSMDGFGLTQPDEY
jgi:hypothetical protein